MKNKKLINILKIILSRRSVRYFDTNKTVRLSKIYKAIEIAIDIFSKHIGLRNIKINIIPKSQFKNIELKKGHQPQCNQAPFTLIFSIKTNNQNNKLLIESGILIQIILLVFTSLGISSLWVSSFNENKVSNFIDKEYKAIALVPIGYHFKSPRLAKRVSVKKRVYFENISKKHNLDEIFDEALKVNVDEYLNKPNIKINYLNTFVKSNKYYNLLKSLFNQNRKKKLSKEVFNFLLQGVKFAPSAKNLQSPEILINKHDNNFLLHVLGNVGRITKIDKVSNHLTTTSERGKNLFIYLDMGAVIANILLICYEVDFSLEYKLINVNSNYVYGYTFNFKK